MLPFAAPSWGCGRRWLLGSDLGDSTTFPGNNPGGTTVYSALLSTTAITVFQPSDVLSGLPSRRSSQGLLSAVGTLNAWSCDFGRSVNTPQIQP